LVVSGGGPDENGILVSLFGWFFPMDLND
jgi:hypothetical protein